MKFHLVHHSSKNLDKFGSVQFLAESNYEHSTVFQKDKYWKKPTATGIGRPETSCTQQLGVSRSNQTEA